MKMKTEKYLEAAERRRENDDIWEQQFKYQWVSHMKL
jgi:hypothetical protein